LAKGTFYEEAQINQSFTNWTEFEDVFPLFSFVDFLPFHAINQLFIELNLFPFHFTNGQIQTKSTWTVRYFGSIWLHNTLYPGFGVYDMV